MTIQGKPISATMATALHETIEHGGELVRHQGGYWSWPGCPLTDGHGLPSWHVGGTTVQALVDRGELQYAEWKEGRGGRFPIRAILRRPAGAAS